MKNNYYYPPKNHLLATLFQTVYNKIPATVSRFPK